MERPAAIARSWLSSDIAELEWIAAFQRRLRALGVQADESSILDMAVEIHSTRGNLDPTEVAQTEWDLWPPES
jgi:hypothetical protein